MADIVCINPRFELSFWGLEACVPFMGNHTHRLIGALQTRSASALNTF